MKWLKALWRLFVGEEHITPDLPVKQVDKRYSTKVVSLEVQRILTNMNIPYTRNNSNGVVSCKVGDKVYQYLPAQMKVRCKQRSLSVTPQQFAQSIAHKRMAECAYGAMYRKEKQTLKTATRTVKLNFSNEVLVDALKCAIHTLALAGIDNYWIDPNNGTVVINTRGGQLKYYATKRKYQLGHKPCSFGNLNDCIKYYRWIEKNWRR